MFRAPGSLVIIIATSVLVFGYTNCAKLTSMKTNGSGDLSSSNGQNGGALPGPNSNEILSFGKTEIPSLKLGEDLTTSIKIMPNTKYSGEVSFEIDRSNISSVVGQQEIVIRIEPKVIKMNGQAQVISLIAETSTSSPSFVGRSFKIKAIAKEPGFKEAILDVPLTIRPEIDILMFGGTIPADRWNRPTFMSFRKHDKPLILNFINYDTIAAHVVHGSGDIPHGGAIMKSPGQGAPGGVYTVTIDSTATRGEYWYHDIENSTFARTMMFNVTNTTGQSVQALGL